MARKLKAALVVVHPYVYAGDYTWQHKLLKFGKEECINRVNKIWEIFGEENLLRITFWDYRNDQKDEWSPIVEQDIDSPYVIKTMEMRPVHRSDSADKLKRVLTELKKQEVTDIFFLGGYRVGCITGAIGNYFDEFRCWIIWDISHSDPAVSIWRDGIFKHLDKKRLRSVREGAETKIIRVNSGAILTRNKLRTFLTRVKPRT